MNVANTRILLKLTVPNQFLIIEVQSRAVILNYYYGCTISAPELFYRCLPTDN